jgi:2,3-bisphosphoglycerate-dependent phosphoglycerate mutase
MITNIYLVRHAHSNYSSDELGRSVSEEGRKNVEYVSKILVAENIEVFISSPYRRAIQTIEDAAVALGIEIELNENFKERILSSTPVEDFETTIQTIWKDPSFSLEGGESNIQAQKRGIEELTHVLERYKGMRVAIGTHGNIMAIIMNYYDSKYNYEFWKGLSMPDIYKLSFDEYSLIDVKRIWEV